MILSAMVLAPIVEELLFRGFLYHGIRRKAGVKAALIVTSAVFALIHPPQVMAPIFVVGLSLGYLYERTGTLIAPIAFHAVFNGWTVAGEIAKRWS